jgi:hypothetical protein
MIEIHIISEEWGHLDIFRSLTDKFIPVNFHSNNNGCYPPEIAKKRGLKSFAYEILLVNKKLIKLKSNSRSFALHPINTINDPKQADCQP